VGLASSVWPCWDSPVQARIFLKSFEKFLNFSRAHIFYIRARVLYLYIIWTRARESDGHSIITFPIIAFPMVGGPTVGPPTVAASQCKGIRWSDPQPLGGGWSEGKREAEPPGLKPVPPVVPAAEVDVGGVPRQVWVGHVNVGRVV
jgi:hypothetical protein